jgi:hypothetical protein
LRFRHNNIAVWHRSLRIWHPVIVRLERSRTSDQRQKESGRFLKKKAAQKF